MGCGSSKVSCPKCKTFETVDGKKFEQHLQKKHTIQCNTCGLYGFKTQQELETHFEKVHTKQNQDFNSDEEAEKSILCPKCGKEKFTDGAAFVKHLSEVHTFASTTKLQESFRPESANSMIALPDSNKRLPKLGEKVLAMWSQSKWQYFHATLVRFMRETLRYEIDWDDGDTTGRIVDYHNIAVDRVPEKNEIGIGSTILFSQGAYKAGATQLTGGKRWHQGCITKIYNRNGITLYDGVHTKGVNDGKFVTYKGYEYEFKGKQIVDFRVGPNVFDILGDMNDDGTSFDDIDIYFSYSKVDNVGSGNGLCDPAEIANNLKGQGLKLIDGVKETKNNLNEKVKLMKNSKVFVACISDKYVLNDQCRMEFQYAKATLRKPVIPLVIGDGMDWMMSVVGMLIAGELYIHFKDKSVQPQKCEEVLKCLSQHITPNDGTELHGVVKNNEVLSGDIFISYCWTNSYLAKEHKQIEKFSGRQNSDPRKISKTLSGKGYSTWLDIDRLTSADKTAGLYEQITKALKDAKVFVPFISDEYARSQNCRMEFQFASKSLNKPIIPVIVGEGEEWKTTVVGAILQSTDSEPINFQKEENFDLLYEKLQKLVAEEKTKQTVSEKSETRSPKKSRVPQPGDHVICHHFNYSYYTATVVGYNISTMEYTVAWDDGDPSGRIQLFNQVALDVVPEPDDVGVGSVIFFPQGSYGATEGNNTGGVRYHEGVVTKVSRHDNEVLLDGNHTLGESDGKWCTYRNYDYQFHNVPLDRVRIAPTALDTVDR